MFFLVLNTAWNYFTTHNIY